MYNNFQKLIIQHLDSISSGNKALNKELIEIFLDQIPEFISNINKFFNEHDFTNLTKEAHTLKSSTLIFGMTNTAKLLKEIQLQSENNSVEQLNILIKNIELELNNAKEQLQMILVEL